MAGPRVKAQTMSRMLQEKLRMVTETDRKLVRFAENMPDSSTMKAGVLGGAPSDGVNSV
jgi:hypothetical protein